MIIPFNDLIITIHVNAIYSANANPCLATTNVLINNVFSLKSYCLVVNIPVYP